MKLTTLLCMGALSALVFTACVDNDDKSVWNDGSQPISFNASIQGMTRAVENKWTVGDKVGIFMKAAGGDLNAALAANKLHTTDANGILTAGNAESALYYPSDGSTVDFVAYYPYAASLTGNLYKVNVTDQTKPADIDLLYSNNATGFAKGTTNNPQLQFAHKLSQIVFNITKDATVPSLDGLTITFKGLNTTADFALADGTLTNEAAPTDIRALVNGAEASAIMIPAAALTGVKVVFVLNGKTFEADYPQTELVGGSKYTHNVKLSDQNGQPVITMDAATISPWNEVTGGDINVDFGEGSDTPEPSEVVLLDESFNAGQGAFTINNKALGGMNFVWAHNAYQNVGYMKASGFYNNTSNACESWLISPVVDLSKATKATLTFMHCDNYSKVDLTQRQGVLTLWATEAAAEQWEQLTIPAYGTGADYNYVASGDIDLSKYAGKSIKFAFKYVCNGTFSATWQIQNVKVVADGGEGGNVDPNPDPTPEPGKEEVIFLETCGDAKPLGSTKSKINDYTGWDNPNLTFNDRFAGQYQNGDVRATATTTNNVWFPAYTTTIEKPAALRISGFNVTNYTNLKLSYSIAANNTSNQNIIKVDCGGTMMTVPDVAITTGNKYQTVELNVPDGISYIEFISDAANTVGLRIDSIKLLGTGK